MKDKTETTAHEIEAFHDDRQWRGEVFNGSVDALELGKGKTSNIKLAPMAVLAMQIEGSGLHIKRLQTARG